MKCFYWTAAWADQPSRFYQVDTEQNFVAEVAVIGVTKQAIVDMLDEGHVEISSATAYKMGLPA